MAETSYKKARIIYSNIDKGKEVEINNDEEGKQIRQSLYAVARRHPGKVLKTHIHKDKIRIWRIL